MHVRHWCPAASSTFSTMSSQFLYYDRLFGALKSVKKPGYFATGGSTTMPLPALRVEGISAQIGLPLTEAQAKAITEKCSQAPFGRGERTIVDTSVRRTWQLDPSQFDIRNPKWLPSMQHLLNPISTALGCDVAQEVSCELYKLLLYEPGGFFKPHRDTEKVKGMFGTLVIQLPSDYEGGQLVVRHQGKKKMYDFSGIEGSTGFHYAAFYADCQHEILEVTKGYRLCLIYNLIYKGRGALPVPADNRQLVTQVVESMTEWATDDSGPSMMAYLLEHQYCDASLSFSALKNRDRAIADLLQSARREVNFDLYLSTVTKTECWSGSHSYGCDCGSYRYGYCNGSCDYETDDLIETNLSASGWATPSGNRDDLGEITLNEDVLMPPGVLDDANPDEEEFQEATGNEGATVDKTYHRASLVVWPLSHRLSVLGLDRMIKKLEEEIVAQHDVPQDSEKWKQSQQLAKRLVALTKKENPSVASAASLLHSLQVFHDHELANVFLVNISSTSQSPGYYIISSSSYIANSQFGDQLRAACSILGWKTLQSGLRLLFETSASKNTEECCQLLFKLVGDDPHPTTEHQEVCQQLASIVCNVILGEHDIAASPTPSYSWYLMSNAQRPRSKDFVCRMLKILTVLHCDTQLHSVLTAFCQQQNRYPLLSVLVPAVRELHPCVDQKSLLLSHCINTLEARTQKAIAKPANWTQSVSLKCSCDDCKLLHAFLTHPTQTQTQFKVKKSRRYHIHQQLDQHKCDATHQTLRQGSPQTLVVTKTRNSFAAKQQQRQREIEALTILRSLCQPGRGQPPLKRQKVEVVDLV